MVLYGVLVFLDDFFVYLGLRIVFKFNSFLSFVNRSIFCGVLLKNIDVMVFFLEIYFFLVILVNCDIGGLRIKLRNIIRLLI